MKCVRPWNQRCLLSLVWCMAIAGMAYPCTGQEGGDASGRPASKLLTVGDLLAAQGGEMEVGECAVLTSGYRLLKIECPPMFTTHRRPPDGTTTVGRRGDGLTVPPQSPLRLGDCGRMIASGILEMVECPPAPVQWLEFPVIVHEGAKIQLGFRADGVVVWRTITSWPPISSDEETHQ
jgi:hypothetical protein